ncbi:MAG: AAA family ATPase [Clostridia bacterium]|nr:AAA family ATPase [Clostridia bacterium]
MKKILTALGNPTLNNELKKYEKYDVVCDDLQYQEAVFDVLESESPEVIILSGLLQGQFEFNEFVLEVKKKDVGARIIIIVDEIDEETKNLLMAKGIFDIFNDNQITMQDVFDAIDREEPLSRVNILREAENEKYVAQKVFEEKETKICVMQKQEVIAISGINGAGKSTIAANLAKCLAKKSDAKILLIDLDTLNGNIDELLGINKIPENVEILIDEDKKCGLNYIADLISKNRFDTNVLEELVIKTGKIDVITGNTSVHSCQNVLNEECYKKLIESAKEKYDFIIIDTSSNIFLDSTKWAMQVANRILFVTEDSYISVKKATQFLYVLEELWNIWKGKIELVINKENKSGIEYETIEKILGIKLIGRIKQNFQDNESEYESILRNIRYIPKLTINERLEKIKELFCLKRDDLSQIVSKGELEHAN